MTQYRIDRKGNGFLVKITTGYRVHEVYITDELRDMRELYFMQNIDSRKKLCSQWEGALRLNSATIENNTDLMKRECFVLCDLALSQAIVNILDNAKGVKHYGL